MDAATVGQAQSFVAQRLLPGPAVGRVREVAVVLADGARVAGTVLRVGLGTPWLTLRTAEGAQLALELPGARGLEVVLEDGSRHAFGDPSPPAAAPPPEDGAARAAFLRLRARAARHAARGRWEEGLVPAREALALAEAGLGEGARAEAAADVAALARALGRLAQAEPLLKGAVEGARRAFGLDHPVVRRMVHDLGRLQLDAGQYAAAEGALQEALALARAWAERTGDTGAALDVPQCLTTLGQLHLAAGRPEAAEPPLREALALFEAARAGGHPDAARCLAALGQLLGPAGRGAEAEVLLQRALEARRAAFGDAHPDTLESLTHLGALQLARGRYGSAEATWRAALDGLHTLRGPEHPDVGEALQCLAHALAAQLREAEAEALLVRALDVLRAGLGDGHPRTRAALGALLDVRRALGR